MYQLTDDHFCKEHPKAKCVKVTGTFPPVVKYFCVQCKELVKEEKFIIEGLTIKIKHED